MREIVPRRLWVNRSDGGKRRQRLKLASMYLVDGVLVDHLMPEMNGQEAALKSGRLMPEAPIIMLSAAIDVPKQVLNLVYAPAQMRTHVPPRMMHDNLVQHATPWPPHSFPVRPAFEGYATLRAFVAVFRAMPGFLRTDDTVFPASCAALTTSGNSSVGCFAAR
jgi:hypothetical protein